MQLDFFAIFSNMFSAIPWWIIPLVILGLYIKLKIEKWEKNKKRENKAKRKKTYKKYDNNYKKQNSTYNYDNVKNSINTQQKKKTLSRAERKAKGDEYEKYVADFFKKQGYYVWEHGKEKGVKDSNIDLFVKKENYIYFVQCKNWETWKIDHHKVKATRTDVRDYLKTNNEFWQLIKNYELKILYVTSKECLTKGAYTYIKENKDIVEYQVIPMVS